MGIPGEAERFQFGKSVWEQGAASLFPALRAQPLCKSRVLGVASRNTAVSLSRLEVRECLIHLFPAGITAVIPLHAKRL